MGSWDQCVLHAITSTSREEGDHLSDLSIGFGINLRFNFPGFGSKNRQSGTMTGYNGAIRCGSDSGLRD